MGERATRGGIGRPHSTSGAPGRQASRSSAGAKPSRVPSKDNGVRAVAQPWLSLTRAHPNATRHASPRALIPLPRSHTTRPHLQDLSLLPVGHVSPCVPGCACVYV